MKNAIAFEIDADGNLSVKVTTAGSTMMDHAAVDKMLNEIAEAIGGDRQVHEQLPPLTAINKQTLSQ